MERFRIDALQLGQRLAVIAPCGKEQSAVNAKIVDEYGIICSFGQLQATLYVYHCRVETERVICLEQAVVGVQPLHVGACPVQPGHECVYVSLLGCYVLWTSCHKTVKPLKVGLGGSRGSLCQYEYAKK